MKSNYFKNYLDKFSKLLIDCDHQKFLHIAKLLMDTKKIKIK